MHYFFFTAERPGTNSQHGCAVLFLFWRKRIPEMDVMWNVILHGANVPVVAYFQICYSKLYYIWGRPGPHKII